MRAAVLCRKEYQPFERASRARWACMCVELLHMKLFFIYVVKKLSLFEIMTEQSP